MGIRQASSASCCLAPAQERALWVRGPIPPPTLLASLLGQAGLGLIVLCDGLARRGQKQQPTGLGARKVPWARVPRNVVSPRVPPSRPILSYQELAALGASRLLARASGHPARPGVGRPSSVSLGAMLCGRQEEGRARGMTRSPQLRSLRASGVPGSPTPAAVGGGGAPSADPGPGSAVRDGGRQGTCQPHAGHPRRGPARLRSSALSGWWNGAEPASRCPCGLCQFQWVMSCPGGGEGSLRSSCLLVLAPKPGLGRPARWRQGGIASAQEGRQGRPGLAPGHRYGGAL